MTKCGTSLLVVTATCVAALASVGCGESSKSDSNAGDRAGQSSGGSAAGTTSGGSASGGSLGPDPNGGSANPAAGKSCVDSGGHQPGSFDTGFGTDGTARLEAEVPANATSFLLTRLVGGADGALFALADSGQGCAVFKLDQDGKPDAGFGTEGTVAVDFDVAGFCFALALDAQGRLLVAGSDFEDAFVTRLAPNGSVDTAFGTDGRTTVDFGSNNDRIVDLVVLDDGSLAGVGSGNSNAAIVDDFTVFFSEQGAVAGGKAVPLEVGEGRQYPVALRQLSDGKLLVLGGNQTLSSAYQAKVDTSGAIEDGYADHGFLRTKDMSFSSVIGFTDSKDGPVAWGNAPGYRLARIDAIGNYQVVGMSDSVIPTAVARQCDGKLLVAGVNRQSGAGLARLTADGAADDAFPEVDWPKGEGHGSQTKQVLIQADGRIVAAGNDDGRLFVARFWP